MLNGSEVKAIREGKANIKEAYVRFIDNELYVILRYAGNPTPVTDITLTFS